MAAIRANSPSHSDQTDRQTPAIFHNAPIEDRRTSPLPFRPTVPVRPSVRLCRRSTSARSRPRSNHLPGIGDRSIANNGHSMDILGNCDDDVEQAAGAGAGAGLASFRVSDLSEREGERETPFHSNPQIAICVRVLRTTCDVMSCVPLSVPFCESCPPVCVSAS